MLTRRAFLRAMGIGLAASVAPWDWLHAQEAVSGISTGAEGGLYGRAFEAAPVFRRAGEIMRYLFPDEIVPIRPVDDDWYSAEGGRVRRANVQPISVSTSWPAIPDIGTVAQVSAPYAPVRAWCAPDAPLKARVGWGGTAIIEDRLSNEAGEWLGLYLPETDTLSWSPARAWCAANDLSSVDNSATLQIDRQARTAALLYRERVLWRADVALSRGLRAGDYVLNGRNPVARTAEPCAPWELDFGAWRLHGVYWHNHFGEAAFQPSSGNIETSVLAAQAIYAHAPAVAHVI